MYIKKLCTCCMNGATSGGHWIALDWHGVAQSAWYIHTCEFVDSCG